MASAAGLAQQRGEEKAVQMTDLRETVQRAGQQDPEFGKKALEMVDQAEAQVSRKNALHAGESLNSLTQLVFSTPENRLPRGQKFAVMVALDKSWRAFRLQGKPAHIRRVGFQCSLKTGRCFKSGNPANICFEALGKIDGELGGDGPVKPPKWSCISSPN